LAAGTLIVLQNLLGRLRANGQAPNERLVVRQHDEKGRAETGCVDRHGEALGYVGGFAAFRTPSRAQGRKSQ
jgi:hypothetical protein